MLIATAFLAVQQILVKELSGIPVAEIILVRAAISLVICSYALRAEKQSFKGKNLPLLVLRGVIGTASLMTFFYTLHHMPLASAVTIGHLSPLFLGALAVYFLKEKMSGPNWLSFLVCFGGVFLLKGFDPRITIFELIIAVLAAFLAALAHFTVRKLKDERPNVVLFYYAAVVIPILAPVVYLDHITPDGYQWILLILVGVVSHWAQYFLTKAFKAEEATKVAGIYYLGILAAVLLGYFLYDESFNLQSYLGMVLILSGLLFTVFQDYFPSLKLKS